jgi:parallel beta-helix repeat protein
MRAMRSIRPTGIILTLCALLLAARLEPAAMQPAVYYVAPHGDDTAPGSLDRPWRTLERVQAALADIPPGSTILLERGGEYPGSLLIDGRVTGTADAPFTLGAYGDPAAPAPILTALFRLTDWIPLGDRRWQTTCTRCSARTDLLLIDGVPYAKARWPNPDEADEGYLYFDGFNGRQALSDDALDSAVDWTGGELVIRSVPWVLDRYPIIGHSGAAIRLGDALDETNYNFAIGYGYFLHNHPAALDRPGEWVHDAATGTITLLWDGDPNQRRIDTTSVDAALRIEFTAQIVVRDLAIHGGRLDGVSVYVSEAVTLTDLAVRYSAGAGVRATAVTGLELADSQIQHHLSNGFTSWECSGCRLHHLVIEAIGLLPGMGRGGDGAYNGADVVGSGSRFDHSIIRRIGYNGLGLRGTVTARHNLIEQYALVKVDSGGIGTYQTRDAAILGNTVLYGLGSDAAIPWGIPAVNGIYIDDDSENITVRGNVVGYVGNSGIYLHNTHRVRVEDNIVFAAAIGLDLVDDELGAHDTTASRIRRNQIVTLLPDAPPVRASTALAGEDWLTRLGTWTDNVYCGFGGGAPIVVSYLPERLFTGLMLTDWRTRYGHDAGSRLCPEAAGAPTLETNPTGQVRRLMLDAAQIDLDGRRYPAGSTLSIPPYSAVILFPT